MSCSGCISPAQPANFGATPLMRTTESLPTWAIVVIVFGILLILILIAVLVCCLCRIGFWCCAAVDSDDERKKKVAGNGWFGRRTLETSSKRPQILYRYPDDDAATIVAGGGDVIATSGSGYVPRALRLTNDRPKTVRVVEDVNFNEDGRPVFVVDGARSSIIGGGTLSSSRLSSSRPNMANEYDFRGGVVDVGDTRSGLAYGSNPHPAVITINGQGISSYSSDVTTHGSQGHGIQASHSASIQVVGGHGSPWTANPVPSVYPAL